MSVVRTSATTVPAYKTLQNVTYNDRGTQFWAFGQLADGSLLGFDATTSKINRSTDDGATWAEYCSFVFSGAANVNGGLMKIRPDGEIVVATGKQSSGGTGAAIWVSSGWAANPSTATFTKTLQLGNNLNFAYHGFGGHKNILLASEYGAHFNETPPYARFVYRSDDGGSTWRTVFDLGVTVVAGDAAPVGNLGGVHLHGCAYDPWWDRMWALYGDSPNGDRGAVYSDDNGTTWHRPDSAPEIHGSTGQWQCLAPIATEAGLLTLPDFVPDCVGRIGRAGFRQTTEFHAAHMVCASTGSSVQSFRGVNWYQSPRAGSPLLGLLVGSGSTSPGVLVTVEDGGRTFRNAFVDPATDGGNSVGFQSVFGPTNNGKYVIYSTYAGRNANGDRIVGELIEQAAAVPLPTNTQVDTYLGGTSTSTQTWTKPARAVSVTIEAINAGGGGGSGRQGAAASARAGGSGGGGGARKRITLPASAVPSTLTIVIPASGVGGAAQATADTNGVNGSNVGVLTVKDSGGNLVLAASGGLGGSGGGTATGTGGAGGNGMFPGGAGANGTIGAGIAGTTTYAGGPGGGSGGGISAADAPGNGGNGGTGDSGVAPTAGNPSVPYPFGLGTGSGGPGGAAVTSGTPGVGQDGGAYGAGGGGGAASVDGTPSGAGGRGAPGIVQITTYF